MTVTADWINPALDGDVRAMDPGLRCWIHLDVHVATAWQRAAINRLIRWHLLVSERSKERPKYILETINVATGDSYHQVSNRLLANTTVKAVKVVVFVGTKGASRGLAAGRASE